MELTVTERKFLMEVFSTYFEDTLDKNFSGNYTQEVIMLDKLTERIMS